MNDYKIWVDMDGVLTNWHKAACECFNVPYPTHSVLGRDWIVAQTGLNVSQLLSAMDAKKGFWEDMLPTPVMPRLVAYLDVNFPDWGILTSATHGSESWGGKAAWVRRYLRTTGLKRLVVCCGNKARFAARNSVLIDDTPKITDKWIENGGMAFRWVEYTSDWQEAHDEQFTELVQFLEPLKNTSK